ncbi:DUF6247 family protein [Saccharopolyspora shandongensis]|uniref:DUF6247 family protein n=1 Tax=Saccharopolyspora shandongensis TaxID=418495 RepID=UPI00340DBD3A
MVSKDFRAEDHARMKVVIDRTGPAVRRALSELDPESCAEFEREFHLAMAEADDDFDLSRVEKVLGRWWAEACSAANPAPYVDELLERIKNGDESIFSEEWRPQPDGTDLVYRKNTEGNWYFSHVRRPGAQ